MKKIYLMAAFIAAGAGTSFAQNIDLEAVNTVKDGTKFCPGKIFSPNDPPGSADSIHGIYGIQANGPDGLLEGDKICYRTSFHDYLTEAEAIEEDVPFEDRFAWYSIAEMTATNVANNGFFFSFDTAMNVGMLCDWELFNEYGADSFKRYGPPHEAFEDGKEYGFFVQCYGMGDDANNIVNTDADLVNNITVARIIWNDCTTGLGGMLAPKKTEKLEIFPNPTVSDFSFNYNFDKNTYVTVYVRDITGRLVHTEKVGRLLAGAQTVKVNIAGLSAGTYNVEMSTGYTSATAKLTINK